VAQIVVRNIPEDTMDGLRELARRRGTSAEQEVRTLIAGAVSRARRLDRFREEAQASRADFAKQSRTFVDSTRLIRQDRDR
jgi:plasmid stability protein